MATLGAAYDEGAPLFRIIRTDRLELRAQVPASDVAAVRDVTSLALEIPGRPDPLALQPHHRHDAGVIDPTTRALPVQFEVDNPGGQLLVGQTGTALLYKKDRIRGTAVPKAAVLLEAGRPYVFVQVGRRTICAPLYRDHHAGRRLDRREGRPEDRRSCRDPWRV